MRIALAAGAMLAALALTRQPTTEDRQPGARPGRVIAAPSGEATRGGEAKRLEGARPRCGTRECRDARRTARSFLAAHDAYTRGRDGPGTHSRLSATASSGLIARRYTQPVRVPPGQEIGRARLLELILLEATPHRARFMAFLRRGRRTETLQLTATRTARRWQITEARS